MNNTSMIRGQRAWIAVVALLAVIAALICWRHLRDGRSHYALGTTVAALDDLVGPTTRTSLQLPDGTYDIHATRPLAGVDSDPGVREQQAPDGGSFVGVQIARTDAPAVTRWGFGDAAATRKPVATDFVLVADGHRYPLTRFDAYNREVDAGDVAEYGTQFVDQRVYVAVSGSPKRLQLETSYDGRKQEVDLRTGKRDAGVFAPLYANKAVDEDCGTPTWTAGFGPDKVTGRACVVDLVQRTPYYPGFGWAASGRTWVVVGVSTQEPDGLRYRAGNVFARYEIFGLPKTSSTLDGAPAKGTGLYSNVFGDSRHDVSLFAAGAGTAPAELATSVIFEDTSRRSDSAGPYRPATDEVTVSWRVGI